MKSVRLGELIELSDLRNTDNKLTLEDVRGVSIEKKFIPTKANMEGVPLYNYKVVKPSWFCYVTVTSRNGGKISLAFQNLSKNIIVSTSYEVFHVKDVSKILPEYLFMLFNRSEFDRYSRFNSWGSARETFDFSELCLVKIPLPSIKTQREIVAAYNGLKNVIDDNLAIAEPLEKLCHSFIVDCKKKYPSVALGDYIEECDERNSEGKYTIEDACGVNTNKEIQDAKRIGEKIETYKIIHQNNIVFNVNIKMSSLGDKFAIALNKRGDKVVSNFYVIFKSVDESVLLPDYMLLWFIREDFARYVKFISCSSVRETFSFNDMCDVKIPLPPIEVQHSIVNIYNCAQEAKRIASEAKEELKNLCPALVQFAAHSA